MTHGTRIFVAGGTTLLGNALLERLPQEGQLVGLPPHEPDLTSVSAVEDFFAESRPGWVFMAAGLSGGIHANQTMPADLMLNNLLIAAHVLDAANRYGVKKLLYLGSSCMYPRLAPQPLRPAMLHTGPLEPSNVAYATAKLAGLELCHAYRHQYGAPFIAGIPANAFGPHDDFCPDTSHVVPALIRRVREATLLGAKTLDIWGTGNPRREFSFAPDVADACVFVMNHYDGSEPINLGGGLDYSIAEVAALIADVADYRGELRFDVSRPDGTPRKCLDSSKLMALGWRPTTPFRDALEATYAWYVSETPRTACHPKRPGIPKTDKTQEAAAHVRSAL